MIGSVISLAYYLRVIAVMWMGRYEVELPSVPPGASPVAAGRPRPTPGPARGGAVADPSPPPTIFFGIWPDPLFDARDVSSALPGLH